MITAIMTELTAIVTGLISAITSGFTNIVNIFWDGTKLTVVGSLILIGAGASVVGMVFNFIKRLFSFRIK